MTSLARVLLDRGWRLSGSDVHLEPVRSFSEEGVCLHEGHAAQHLPDALDLVIRSDAVPDDNPELVEAARRGIPVVSYFEMLGRLMENSRGLAVAGTHGKSTTTAMAAEILVCAGLDPTVVCGATPLGRTSGGRAGDSNLMLVEACEYRAHFLHLRPEMAVIHDIEPDHFDYYDSLDQIEAAFGQFVARVPSQGRVLVRQECAAARRAVAAAGCRVETFGLTPRADWSAQPLGQNQGRYRFEISHRGRRRAEVSLQVPGEHNMVNALAAAAISYYQGVPPATIAQALGRFRGLKRRLQQVGTFRGVELLDDYAHHPTEVKATLAAIRQMYLGRRVWCVFQPHQASRTARLLDEFAASLENTDKVLVAEIYRAREPAAGPGDVTAADLARAVRSHGMAVPPVHDLDSIARLLLAELAVGDVLVTIGAGDIGTLHRRMKDLVVRGSSDSAAA
jgi:UDP-N-acetylmuramate--alanine ligase